MKRLVLALSTLLTLSGCALLNDYLALAAVAVQPPAFTFRTAEVKDVTLAGLTLDTVWELSNPNDVSVSLASVDYALFIDGKQVLAGSPPNGLTLEARGSTQLHFPAAIRFVDLGQVVEIFLTKDTAKWRAEGSLGVQTPIGVLKVPLAHEDVFEVPKVPQVAFKNPRVTGLTLTGATLEFPLTVTNRNGFPLPVGALTGTLAIGGSSIGTVTTGELGQLTAKGTRDVSIPVNVSFLSAASAVLSAAQGGNARVTFDAQLSSGGQVAPIKLDQLLQFAR